MIRRQTKLMFCVDEYLKSGHDIQPGTPVYDKEAKLLVGLYVAHDECFVQVRSIDEEWLGCTHKVHRDDLEIDVRFNRSLN